MIERLWIFDINRRVYERDEKGHTFGSPIWREHWREEVVIGETARSWLIGHKSRPRKVSKKGGPGIAFSRLEIEEAAYAQVNAHRIADEVRRCRDARVLREIAALVGYQERA